MTRGQLDRVYRLFAFAALWGGLVLCVLLVAHYWDLSRELIFRLNWLHFGVVALGLSAMWGFSCASWRRVAAAFGMHLRWSDAARQLALLLLGKYLPGGFWGFVARFADGRRESLGRQALVAGICEQIVTFTTLTFAGAVLIAASLADPLLLFGLALAPLAAVSPLAILRSCLLVIGRCFPRVAGYTQIPPTSSFFAAAIFTAGQTFSVVGITWLICYQGLGVSASAALGLAGSYAVATTLGGVVFVAPGGVVVRELAFVSLATTWLNSDAAIALAVSFRLLFSVFDMLSGVVLLPLRSFRMP